MQRIVHSPVHSPIRKVVRSGMGEDGGPGSFAPGPAPAGYHWEFVYDLGVRVTDSGEPVVDLVRNI